MSKLVFSVDFDFKTAGFQITEECENKLISGNEAKKFCEKVSTEDLSIFLFASDPDDEFGGMSFELPVLNHKKGTVNLVTRGKFDGLDVEMKGDFVLKVRSGVKETIKKNWPLRIAGIAYLGGAYRGYMSYIAGQNEDNQEDWLTIPKYEIK